jgi:chemotaxis protein histidine kinase CheA
MARSLRSFLIVEAAGQRLAIPWSAIERIYATRDEVPRGNGAAPGEVHPLAELFAQAPDPAEGLVPLEGGDRGQSGALAVLRCGSTSAVVAFDRIVWRENARLRPMPNRLDPVDEVLGGIVAPDSSITLVLNPAVILRRIVEGSAASAGGGS